MRDRLFQLPIWQAQRFANPHISGPVRALAANNEPLGQAADHSSCRWLKAKVGLAPILNAPPEVATGIPADLLRRRPDVRAAERQAAAQCAQIGVAESNFYPNISITGTLGYSAESFKDLFKPTALNSTVGPSFQWNILNYGRILNNVRLQEATFRELVFAYQNTVLTAAQDVVNGLTTFLNAQQRTKFQNESVVEALEAVDLALAQYKGASST